MAVFRVHKNENYSVINNSLFKDKDLSYKGKGLLATMLSLPDNWNYSVEGLASLSTDGVDSVRNTIHELEKLGYIVRTQNRTENGKLNGYMYDIYETPHREKPSTENPSTANPSTENPSTENPRQLNTNILNTNKLSNNILNTKEYTPIIPQQEAYFEEWWNAYPNPNGRRTAKKQCKAKFLKIKDLETEFPKMMKALEIQKKSKQWTEKNGQYVPMSLTYLNQFRWKDVDFEKSEAETAADNALFDFLNNNF